MAKGVSRCLRVLIRALSRARDSYVRSMIVSYEWASSGEDDLRELINATYQGRLLLLSQVAKVGDGVGGGVAVPRSQNVVIGRIDEEHPCEFFDDEVGVGSNLLLPRSRNCSTVAAKRRLHVIHS